MLGGGPFPSWYSAIFRKSALNSGVASAKSASERRTQRWLAKLPGQPAILDTEKLLKRSARRLALIAASGFDPADDDRVF